MKRIIIALSIVAVLCGYVFAQPRVLLQGYPTVIDGETINLSGSATASSVGFADSGIQLVPSGGDLLFTFPSNTGARGFVKSNEMITCVSDVCTEDATKDIHYITSDGDAGGDDALAMTAGVATGQVVTYLFAKETAAGDTVTIDSSTQIGWSAFVMAEVGDTVTFVWGYENWMAKSAHQAGAF